METINTIFEITNGSHALQLKLKGKCNNVAK